MPKTIDIIFTNLKERLENKERKGETKKEAKLIKQKSLECEENIGKAFYKLQIKPSDGTYGANEKEQFIFILLTTNMLK